MLHLMIMAGGGGTRFWPRSRQQRPKQFLTFASDRTLLQQALDRAEAIIPPDQSWIITGEAYVDETAQQCPKLVADQIVGEPCGRDTAPCIGLGAALIHRRDPEAVMLVTPADHVIQPHQEFHRAVHVAAHTALEHPQALVTFGIPPTFPSTGYGYIHRGTELAVRQGLSVNRVSRFEEKPPHELAERFVASGEHLWNSGIFTWRASAILDELKANGEAVYSAVQRIADAWDTPERQAVLRREYDQVPKGSIDKVVMEHAREVLVIQAPYKWDDVGSWLALERMQAQDAEGNTVEGLHCGLKTSRCIVAGDPDRLIATVGVNDLIIIQDGNATLVADRRDEGTIKELVGLLRQRGLENFL